MRQGGFTRGFTLLDTLIGTFIFLLVGIVVFTAYTNLMRLVRVSSERVAAGAILNEQLERVRNIPFSNLGLVDGIPNGTLEPSLIIDRNSRSYLVSTYVRNVDDPFDGILGNNLDDVRLPFSAQVGNGGLTIVNNSSITGKVFSNGNVLGDNSADVTDSVWVATPSNLSTLNIGGNAYADTITGSEIDGDAYYTSISGTTVGGALHPGTNGPAPQPLPISDAEIAEWKAEAEAEGTMGSVTLGGSDKLTIGPVKINGNLTLTQNAVLTLTGTVWVTGNVNLSNQSAIQLHSSYSSASGLLIADGKISIDNNTAGCGSEGYSTTKNKCNTFSGSYLVMISTNTSIDPLSAAINMRNSTRFKGILYTNTGLINIENSAEVVEATGYAIRLDNGAHITYGTGLFNLLITGNPAIGDTSPGDYKLVEVRVHCLNCPHETNVAGTTTVAPVNLETLSGNGALLIQVYDAVGQPVSGATVTIVNQTFDPDITHTDITDIDGRLLVIDVPPADESYEITITKDGYSTDQTYPIGAVENPQPLQPHATVIANAVTQVSFAIDRVSGLSISSTDPLCSARGGIDFDLSGSKLIGQAPDILKYQESHITDVLGELVLKDMEWDTYSGIVTDANYYLGGSLPSMPFELPPGANESLIMIMEPKTTNALLVEAVDAVNGQPIEGVDIAVAGPSYGKTLTTGEGHWQQTNWSGGNGQLDFSDPTRFLSSSNMDINNPAGELKLQWTGINYAPSGWLESSTFDNATSTNFYHLVVRPSGQPPETGTDPIRIQIASNKDALVWNFVGPDGTPGTYYTPNDRTLNAIHNGDRYIRYRVELSTASLAFTPNISDIAISFASECSPSGQVYFNDVGTGTYTITASKTGYQTTILTLPLVAGWQQAIVELSPQ